MNLACLLGVTACAAQPSLPLGPGSSDPQQELTARIQQQPEPAVLFVGNSYSFGVPKAFAQLAAEQGRKLRVGHATYGGWTLERHAQNEATLRKIRDGKWDLVVIQEQSEIPAWSPPRCAAAMFPPLRQLVTAAHQQGAIALLYQTWGRRDGNPKVRHDDFHAMTARLRAGYHAAATNAGGLLVVPVGDAWETEVTAGRGAALFIEDGSHPTPRANRLTAAVFFRTIFRQGAGSLLFRDRQ